MTVRTRRLCLHRAENSALHACDNSRAVTRGARMECCAVLRACAVAMVASNITVDFKLLRNAVYNVFKRHFHIDSQIAAAVHAAASAASAEASEATETAASEDVAEL